MVMDRFIGSTSGIGPNTIHIYLIHPKSKDVRRLWYSPVYGKAYVLGPFVFKKMLPVKLFLNMLKNQLMSQLDALGKRLPDYLFQQDGAPALYATVVSVRE